MNIQQLTEKLIGFESLSYHEEKIAEYIVHFFRERGIEAELDTFNPSEYLTDGHTYPDTANVYVPIGKSDHTLIFYAHTDVVTGTDNQFKPIVNDKKQLCGRGTADMKSSLAGLMLTAIDMANVIRDSGVQVIFAFIADEETSGTGARHHVKRLREDGFDETNLWAVLTEPTDGFQHIHVGGKGYAFLDLQAPLHDMLPALQGILAKKETWLKPYGRKDGFSPSLISLTSIRCHNAMTKGEKITTTGKAGHVSRPHEGENALEKMLAQLNQPIANMDTHNNSPNQFPEICDAYLVDEYADDIAYVTLDMRLTLEADKSNALLNLVTDYLGTNKINYRIRDYGVAYQTMPNSPLISVCRSAIAPTPQLATAEGGSDAGYYREITPHIIGGFGPGELKQCHQPDEHIQLEALQKSPHVFSNLVLKYIENKTEK